MDFEALHQRLIREGFHKESFRVGGGMPDEGYVLKRHAAGWLIEYCERGGCRDVESFSSEEAACDRMYALMLNSFPRHP
jgi:hypothetical protein